MPPPSNFPFRVWQLLKPTLFIVVCNSVRYIVFRPTWRDKEDLDLLRQYPPPMAAKFTISDSLLESDIRRETYQQRMHDLLYIEEMAQFSSIAKYVLIFSV